jgi:hypothetical protein
LNKTISSILLTALTLLLATPILSVAPTYGAQTASVTVNPPVSSAVVGDMFTVEVDVSGVTQMIGYAATLSYDGSILHAVAVDFQTNTVIAAACNANQCLQVAGSFSDATGTVQVGYAVLGTTSIPQGAILFVTFQVVGVHDVNLSLSQVTIAANVNGVSTNVPAVTTDGTYLAPPNILLAAPIATAKSYGRSGCSGTGSVSGCRNVTLTGYISLSPSAPRAGFGGVEFTLIGPLGTQVVDSNIAFLFPGQSTTVQFSQTITGGPGNYELFATALQCPFPTACILGGSGTGTAFVLKR